MWQLAWRNLWRNRSRTLILGGAVLWTFALFLISLGLQADQHGQMEREAARTTGGDLLVHGAGWWEVQTGDIVLHDAERVAAELRSVPGVAAVIPRIVSGGLVQSARESAGARLVAIDPIEQRALDDPGRWLVDGHFLDGDEDYPIVLGAPLVRDLGVQLGDRIVWMAGGADGEVRRFLFRLDGVLDSGSETRDRSAAYTTLVAAREALGMETGDVTQLGVVLVRGAAIDEVRTSAAARLASDLHGHGPASEPVEGRPRAIELLTWAEAMPDMVGFLRIDRLFNILYMLVLFLVVAFGIANTFLMVLLERIRELGLLGALGLTPRGLASAVLIEFSLLVGLAMLGGLLVGLGGHFALDRWGIDMRNFSEDLEMGGIALDGMVLRSRVVVSQWVMAGLSVGGLALAAAIYPAVRAARLDPAEAMRTWG